MKKRIAFILLIALLSAPSLIAKTVTSSNQQKEHKEKKFNFGIKGGFNSSIFIINKLKIADRTIDNYQKNYMVGNMATLFCRYNFKRQFIQTELSFDITNSEIEFPKYATEPTSKSLPEYSSIKSKIYSIDLPILWGYKLVDNAPYNLSVFIGPEIRYILDNSSIEVHNFDAKNINELLLPFNLSGVVGVSVSISKIFFDFRYEHGFTNISKQIYYTELNNENGLGDSKEFTFDRREGILSFSFGLMF